MKFLRNGGENMVGYNYAIKMKNTEGFILLGDDGAEERAKKLLKDTDLFKDVNKSFKLSKELNEIFLGFNEIKSGMEFGILITKDKSNYKFLNSKDFVKCFNDFIDNF